MTAKPPAKNHPWRKAAPRWTHNVQHIRLAFPPFTDTIHHEKLLALHKGLVELLAHHDLPTEPSYLGFYRADSNWDNIDRPTDSMTHCDRGSRDSEIDNAP